MLPVWVRCRNFNQEIGARRDNHFPSVWPMINLRHLPDKGTLLHRNCQRFTYMCRVVLILFFSSQAIYLIFLGVVKAVSLISPLQPRLSAYPGSNPGSARQKMALEMYVGFGRIRVVLTSLGNIRETRPFAVVSHRLLEHQNSYIYTFIPCPQHIIECSRVLPYRVPG